MNRNISAFMTTLFLLLEMRGVGQYHVIQVSGIIKFEKGDYVRPGTLLTKDPKLSYTSSSDAIRAIDTDGKVIVFVAPGNVRANKKDNEFWYSLLSLFTRIESRGVLNSRSSKERYLPDDLISDRFTLVENSNRYLFNLHAYPTGKGVFFVQIDIPGQSSLIRQLSAVSDTLIIRYKDLIVKNARYDNVRYSLKFHRNNDSHNEIVVNIFKPYFDSTKQFESMMHAIIDYYKGTDVAKDSVRQVCFCQVYEALGKPASLDFDQHFDQLYSLSAASEKTTRTPDKIHVGNICFLYPDNTFAKASKP